MPRRSSDDFNLSESCELRKYERLPPKEREALERAFFHYDADLSGFLEWDEVLPALRAARLRGLGSMQCGFLPALSCPKELGLSGSNAIEKREPWPLRHGLQANRGLHSSDLNA